MPLDNISESMLFAFPSGAFQHTVVPTQPNSQIATAILGVDIATHVKFEVTSTRVNFSKWRQIFTFLLTLYKALDHVMEGAAPRDLDDT
jgi:hypothetical protein